jgi:hypothetical protein
MKRLFREGSSVVFKNDLGEIWLTRRKKTRHDSRRRKPCHSKKPSVIYIPIKQLV